MRFRVARHGTSSSPALTFEVNGRSLGPSFHPDHLQVLFGFCLFEVAFYVAYRCGMSFSQVAASPFWFPDSVLLCALLVTSPKRWWIFILLPLPIRLFSEVAQGIPLWFLLTTFWIDSAKGLIAAFALRGFVARTFRLETAREIGAFFAFAVVLVPAASAFFGATARSALGHEYWQSWEQWFLGDALAQMIVTPAILHWGLGLSLKSKMPDIKRRLEIVALTLGLLLASYAATNTGPSSIDFAGTRAYLPVPLLFWAAFRFGMRGASGAVAITAIFAVDGALHGRGPFSDLSPPDITLALQNFLLLRSVPLFLVAAVIAQRKEVETRLLESEDRFRNMANAAPVLLWVSGRDMQCEFVNESWLELTGRSLNEVSDEGWRQDVHPDDQQHLRETCQLAQHTRQPFEIEYRLRRHDGEYRWVVHRAALRYAADGEYLGYIGSVIDITDRKLAEENARHLSHAQRLVIVGELSAAIAHEVRQPLSAILSNAGAAEALLKSPGPPLDELQEIISDVRADVLRADEIVGRIREFLRNQTTRTQSVDVNAVVGEAIHFISADARRRRIQVRTDLAPRLPAISADRTQLLQVLLNLLVNGMDAMEDTDQPDRYLTIRTMPHGSSDIEITVIDRGRGIAPDESRRLFEPFFTTKSAGMGLGLSIVRSIVIAHRGHIWADNNADRGASFHVVMPVTGDGPS
ncbi:MAG: MASE1 domain-containing protein [Dongiaceae bacterium]